MYFASDNSGPVHPQVLEALSRANQGHVLGYGNDDLTRAVTAQIRTLFEAPEAEVWLTGTGTAANTLALSSMACAFQTIYCTPVAHIHEDECNGVEFQSGGAKLMLVGQGDKLTPEALCRVLDYDIRRGQSAAQMGPVSITEATERGHIYDVAEVTALTALARSHGLPVHMDGARFANAVAALGCTPAEITWRAGVSALSFGGTKNGLMGVEAVVFFDPALAQSFALRRQRAGHTFSKHRYLAAQMQAYLSDDLWLSSAAQANANRAQLEAGLRKIKGVEILGQPQVNMIFARIPAEMDTRLRQSGATYYAQPADAQGYIPLRLVCDWSILPAEIDRFLSIAAQDTGA